jgi:shikimate kinase
MKIIICGPSGAGKTTLLKQFHAKHPEYKCIDLDHFIADKNKVSYQELGELIDSRGWDWFREQEELSVTECLNNNMPVVIALGAGALSEKMLGQIEKQADHLLWLRTDLKLCWQRVMSDPNRPLVKLGEAHFYKEMNKREKMYSKGQVITHSQDLFNIVEN